MTVINNSSAIKKYVDTQDSKKVSKTGDTMTGNLDFSKQWGLINFRDSVMVKGVAPSSWYRTAGMISYDKNGKQYGMFSIETSSTNDVLSKVYASTLKEDGSLIEGYLSMRADRNGGVYATCPTPSAKNDNSTKIATTQWVNTASTVVHTTGNETIAGTKTFTATPVISLSGSTAPIQIKNTGHTYNETPSTYTRNSIYWVDKNAQWECAIDYFKNTANGTLQLNVRNNKGSSLSAPFKLVNPDSGSPYATAPTTPTNSTSNEIATANWCNNKFGPKTVFDTNTDGLVPHPTTSGSGKFLRADGTWAAPSYTLPTASTSTLGGVKVGSGLKISSGVLSTGPLCPNFGNDYPETQELSYNTWYAPKAYDRLTFIKSQASITVCVEIATLQGQGKKLIAASADLESPHAWGTSTMAFIVPKNMQFRILHGDEAKTVINAEISDDIRWISI